MKGGDFKMKIETRLLKAHRKLNGKGDNLWEVKPSITRNTRGKNHTIVFEYPLLPFKKGELIYIKQIAFG
jgi:hypothetical protein